LIIDPEGFQIRYNLIQTVVINFLFHSHTQDSVPRGCQSCVLNSKITKHWTTMAKKAMAARLSSEQEVQAILCNAIHSNQTLWQVQFTVLPIYSIYHHVTSPKKNQKNTSNFLFWCSSHPLIFFSVSRNC